MSREYWKHVQDKLDELESNDTQEVQQELLDLLEQTAQKGDTLAEHTIETEQKRQEIDQSANKTIHSALTELQNVGEDPFLKYRMDQTPARHCNDMDQIVQKMTDQTTLDQEILHNLSDSLGREADQLEQDTEEIETHHGLFQRVSEQLSELGHKVADFCRNTIEDARTEMLQCQQTADRICENAMSIQRVNHMMKTAIWKDNILRRDPSTYEFSEDSFFHKKYHSISDLFDPNLAVERYTKEKLADFGKQAKVTLTVEKEKVEYLLQLSKALEAEKAEIEAEKSKTLFGKVMTKLFINEKMANKLDQSISAKLGFADRSKAPDTLSVLLADYCANYGHNFPFSDRLTDLGSIEVQFIRNDYNLDFRTVKEILQERYDEIDVELNCIDAATEMRIHEKEELMQNAEQFKNHLMEAIQKSQKDHEITVLGEKVGVLLPGQLIKCTLDACAKMYNLDGIDTFKDLMKDCDDFKERRETFRELMSELRSYRREIVHDELREVKKEVKEKVNEAKEKIEDFLDR